MIKGLPEKLRTLRKQYGFSQREAASRLGISTSVISAYENGERTPSTDNLLALSYLYKCSTDYLLGRETDPAEGRPGYRWSLRETDSAPVRAD